MKLQTMKTMLWPVVVTLLCLLSPVRTQVTSTGLPPTGVQPKDGACPEVSILGNFMRMFGLCTERCVSDSQCPGDKKCCDTGCGHACTDPAKPDILKAGTCPVSRDDFLFGFCLSVCQSDQQCPSDLKCCEAGCSKICLKPVPEDAVPKPGTCPTEPGDMGIWGVVQVCFDMCQADTSCPRDQKCCSNGCGQMCMEPKVPCPVYRCKACPYGYRKDRQGCSTCECVDPCERIRCGYNEECVVTSHLAGSPGFPQCVPRNPCPDLLCPATLSYCQFGFKTDPNGCQTCECRDPCQDTICPDNEVCEVAPSDCLRAPCPPPQAVCRPRDPCHEISCDMECQFGYTTDSSGCNMCQCLDLCQDQICPDNEVCEVAMSACQRAPCPPPQAVCRPRDPCPEINCNVECQFGYTIDPSGCKMCQCQDLCQDKICPDNEVCEIMTSGCLGSLCPPPEAVCRPREACPKLQCLVYCEHGFQMDARGCQTCECQDPCSKLECADGLVCQVLPTPCPSTTMGLPCPPQPTCVPKEPTICPVVQCANDCQGLYAKDQDGCLTCQCEDPCGMMKCPSGSECQIVEVMCFRAPCPAQAHCVPTGPLVKPGECPNSDNTQMMAGICVEMCQSDNMCPRDQKCCSNGCGHLCMDPALEPPPPQPVG